MNPNTNDHAVLKQIERIWTRDRPAAIRKVARKARRPVDDPEVQDAMTQAFERLHRFLARGQRLDESTAVGWLIVVGWREFLRLTRRDHRTVALTDTVLATLPDPDPQPEVRDPEIDPALAAALARLTPLQRAVFHGVANGETYADIAQRCHVSPTAVNKALNRARKRLTNDTPLLKALGRLTD